MKLCLLLLAGAVGCGGGSFGADVVEGGGDGSADVLEHDSTDLPDVSERDASDASADVLEHDSADPPDAVLGHDASVGDAPTDSGAPMCIPLAFPLPPPPHCAQNYGPPVTAPGSLWLLQTEASPMTCRSYSLAGSAACEDCTGHFDCACLQPLLAAAGASSPWTVGTTGAGCVDVDGGGGAYFSQ